MDVPGSGTEVRLAGPCKPLETAEDELFVFDHPGEGQIYMEAYDLCAEAIGQTAGSTVVLQPCSDSPNQRFVVDCRTVRLAIGGQPDLCLAVDHNDGIPTGGHPATSEETSHWKVVSPSAQNFPVGPSEFSTTDYGYSGPLVSEPADAGTHTF